jgi:transcriptional regulator with XRE-family HTH domain
MTAFSKRIDDAMRARGISLRELCREAKLDPSFFSKVLSGKRSPPSEESALRRLARVLNLDEAELIVSAGRVPAEWSALSDDKALFSRVHELASGKRAVPVRPAVTHQPIQRAPERGHEAPRILPAKPSLSEELL